VWDDSSVVVMCHVWDDSSVVVVCAVWEDFILEFENWA